MSRRLPSPREVTDLLEELLGRTVTVTADRPGPALDPAADQLISIFVDDAGRTNVVVGMDLPLAVYCGAAIGLIPISGARASIEERNLSSMIAENVTEVCNVLGALFNREGLPPVRMHQTYLPGETAPAEALLRGRRLDLTVEVHGYGRGTLAVILAD